MSQNIRNLDKSIHRDNAKHEKKDRHSQIWITFSVYVKKKLCV